MATHKSDLLKAKDSLAVSDKSAFNANRTNATVLQATAVYTMDGTLQSGDMIELAELPSGATVIPQQCYIADSFPTAFGYGGSSPVLYLGVNGDGRYGTAQYLQFGYSRNFGTEASATGNPTPFTKATRVTASFGYVPYAPKGGKLVFGIAYTING